VTVERMDGTTVRTLEPGPLAAGAQSLTWDGRDGAGARLPDGDYRFAIRGTAPGGVAVTVTRAVAVSAALVSARTTPAMISPNGDGKADRTTVTFTLRGAADVSVSVRDGSGRTVRTLARGPRIAGVGSVAWDGRAGSTATSRTVPQGSYTIDVSATTASGTWSIQLPVAVSVSGVAVSGLAATPVFPFADGYRDESSISFTQAGPATSTVYLYRAGSTKAYRALSQGRLSKGRATASWDGRDAAGRVATPGTYRVRVRTIDAAGVARWSGYANVTVSAKRLYPAVFTATLSGDQRSTASFASLPDAAAVEPSPALSRGVRLRSDVSGEFAVGVWTFAHPAWTQVTSAIVWVDCVRDADGDTDVGAWTGFDVVGGGTIGGTGGRVENLLSPASIPTGSRDVSVAVRQSGPGRVDIATVTIEVRYTFLR